MEIPAYVYDLVRRIARSRMGDDPEPQAVAKKVYKCGEDDSTLPNRFGKIDGSQAHHSQVRKHFHQKKSLWKKNRIS